MKKIIIHNGKFHCDDVLAVVFLQKIFGPLQIHRINDPMVEDLSDPDVLVVDVGRTYAPEMGNFDHHQDPNMPAACLLVYDQFSWMLNQDPWKVKRIREKIFVPTSTQDLTGEQISPFCNISILNTFLYGFDIAVEMVKRLFNAWLNKIDHDKIDFIVWHNNIHVDGVVAVNNFYINSWKEWARETNTLFFIYKSERNDGWDMQTINSDIYPILGHCTQTFLHNAGFIANYKTKKHAIEHAKFLDKNYRECSEKFWKLFRAFPENS
jgi:hypothetical protein